MEELKEFLLEKYESDFDIDVREKFKQWINSCETTDIDSARLLYCIGIDTKYELVDKSKYVRIFDQIDYESGYKPQIQFQIALEKDDGKYHFFSNKNSKFEDDQYCGMIKLWAFANYYLEREYKNDEMDFIKERLEDGFYLNVAVKNNSSEKPREVSWVTLLSEIEAITNEAIKSKSYTIEYICNKLGLYWSHMGTEHDPQPDWVRLAYPPNIDEDFFQPIAANADWKTSEGLYLSYRTQDDFGRTRSQIIDYSQHGTRERVHYRIDKEYIYSAKYIGKAKNCAKNTNTILKSAKKRFNDGK